MSPPEARGGAVAYDWPVLAILARTRRLKSACLVIIVSRGPALDPSDRRDGRAIGE
jgi:hypothetical protein